MIGAIKLVKNHLMMWEFFKIQSIPLLKVLEKKLEIILLFENHVSNP